MRQPTTYAFGPFVIDLPRRLLLRDGASVPLTPKVFDLLVLLVQNRERLVQKDEIVQHLWPNTHVSDTNLAVNVSMLRKALGDSRDSGTYIVTAPGRGYRFAAPITAKPTDDRPPSPTNTRLNGPSTRVHSLAVLPLQCLSAAARDEFLGVGLTDAIISRLSRLSMLTVRPTTSVLQYAGQEVDVSAAGIALRVESILTGTVQRVEDRVRVTVQLVRVRDGSALWAQAFDERARDVFQLEDSVSRKVVRALSLELSSIDQHALTVQHTQNSEAYELYLRSRFFWNKRTEESLLKGIEYGEAAVREDPSFALAHVAIADCYIALAFFGGLRPTTAYTRAIVAAGKALAFDGSLAEAHTSLACASLNSWDWPTAAGSFARALELNPQYPNAHNWHTVYLLSIGRAGEAVQVAHVAQQLDPLSLVLTVNVGWVHYHARQYDAALAQVQRALEMDRHYAPAYWVAGLSLVQLGRVAEAVDQLQQAVTYSAGSFYTRSAYGYASAIAGRHADATGIADDFVTSADHRYVSPHHIAHVYLGLNDHDRAFAWLQRAYADRSDYLVLLRSDPLLDPLRRTARFQSLVERVGIPAA